MYSTDQSGDDGLSSQKATSPDVQHSERETTSCFDLGRLGCSGNVYLERQTGSNKNCGSEIGSSPFSLSVDGVCIPTAIDEDNVTIDYWHLDWCWLNVAQVALVRSSRHIIISKIHLWLLNHGVYLETLLLENSCRVELRFTLLKSSASHRALTPSQRILWHKLGVGR
jgi:hypothetical protein